MLKISMIIIFMIFGIEYAKAWCNCIRPKDCLTFRDAINNGMHEFSRVFQRIRNSSCGYTAFAEPLVCCPTQSMESIDFNNDDNDNSKFMRDRWVWDRRPITTDKNIMSTNLIDDYVDWKTQRNCPPILFKETNSKFHKNIREQNGHNLRPHHHHHHHHHNYHPPKDYDFGDDFIPNKFHHNGRPPFYNNNDNDTDNKELLPGGSSSQHRPEEMTKTTTSPPTCGVTLNNRIIGGIEALPEEFPWIARIAYLNRTDGSVAYRCTGSFISEFHIITAAHCVANLDTSLNISYIRLVDLNNGSPVSYEIAETIVHPNYDSPKRANDIALIKIRKPSNINLNYGIICLPPTNSDGVNQSTAIVAGWSDEGSNSSNTVVRYLKLEIMNNSDCADRYNVLREGFADKITILSSMVCTQDKSKTNDVCRGDSGGPLMDDGSSIREGRYTLIGIVAFGPACGSTNLIPGVYMRISVYVDWILSKIS